jgi:hypothetical protein
MSEKGIVAKRVAAWSSQPRVTKSAEGAESKSPGGKVTPTVRAGTVDRYTRLLNESDILVIKKPEPKPEPKPEQDLVTVPKKCQLSAEELTALRKFFCEHFFKGCRFGESCEFIHSNFLCSYCWGHGPGCNKGSECSYLHFLTLKQVIEIAGNIKDKPEILVKLSLGSGLPAVPASSSSSSSTGPTTSAPKPASSSSSTKPPSYVSTARALPAKVALKGAKVALKGAKDALSDGKKQPGSVDSILNRILTLLPKALAGKIPPDTLHFSKRQLRAFLASLHRVDAKTANRLGFGWGLREMRLEDPVARKQDNGIVRVATNGGTKWGVLKWSRFPGSARNPILAHTVNAILKILDGLNLEDQDKLSKTFCISGGKPHSSFQRKIDALGIPVKKSQFPSLGSAPPQPRGTKSRGGSARTFPSKPQKPASPAKTAKKKVVSKTLAKKVASQDSKTRSRITSRKVPRGGTFAISSGQFGLLSKADKDSNEAAAMTAPGGDGSSSRTSDRTSGKTGTKQSRGGGSAPAKK